MTAVDPMGHATTMAYDKNDRMTSVTDALKQTESFIYDGADNVTAYIDKAGEKESYIYDAHNNLIKKTESTGRTTNYTYDKNNNLIKVTDPAGNVTVYTYNNMNELSSFTDALGRTTDYSYDLEGHLTMIKDAQERVEQAGYDTLGRLTSYTDNSGAKITYDYDKLNALIEKSYEDPEGKTSAPSVAYGYDSTGQRVSMADSSGNSSYEYDALGRITKVTDGSGQSVIYHYDDCGQLEKIVYPDESTVTYTYDKNGNLTQVTDVSGDATDYVYDALDRVTEIHRPNGTRTIVVYDSRDQIIELRNLGTDNETELSSYTYTYDARGYIIKEVGKETTTLEKPGNHYGWNGTGAWGPNGHKGGKVTETEILREYTYDDQGRLTGCSEKAGEVKNTYSYTYDAVGNRQSYKETSDGKTVSDKTYIYNDANQLIRVTENSGKKKSTTTYTYDAAGNCIGESDGNTTTSYDYTVENRLKAVRQGKTLLMAVAYDGDGNRIFQLDLDKDNGKSIRSVKLPEDTSLSAKELYELANTYPGSKFTLTAYINDVNRKTTETLMESSIFGGKKNSGKRIYTYGLQRESVKTDQGTSYYLYDRQGSVSDLLGSSGAETASYTYDGFGQMIQGAPAYGNVYAYNGESYNVQTQYLYLRARYYDTGTGRFTSEDSYLGDITEPLSLNRYAYGLGNPMKYKDPSGYAAEIGGDFGGGNPKRNTGKQTSVSPMVGGMLNGAIKKNPYRVGVDVVNTGISVKNTVVKTNKSNQAKQQDHIWATYPPFDPATGLMNMNRFGPLDDMFLNTYLNYCEGLESRDSDSIWDKMKDAGQSVSDFWTGARLTINTWPMVGAGILDLKDGAVNWFKGLIGLPVEDKPTHIEQLQEKTMQEILEGYEKAENKDAFAKGVQIGDYGNTLGIEGPMYIAYGLLLFGEVAATGIMGSGLGISGNAGNPALAINGNAALAMAGVEIAVADGNVLIIQPPKPVTDYYSNLKKATGDGNSGDKYEPGDKTPKGREYTQHAAERANERGFDSQKIDSIIDNNYTHRVKEIDDLTGEVTWRYQDKRGNTVITNEWGDRIVTVYSYPESANGGYYIPKN